MIQVSMEAEERDASVVSAFLLVSLLISGDDHPIVSNFRCRCRTPGHLEHTSRPMNFSDEGFEHCR